jgi:hypothetical protein
MSKPAIASTKTRAKGIAEIQKRLRSVIRTMETSSGSEGARGTHNIRTHSPLGTLDLSNTAFVAYSLAHRGLRFAERIMG